MLAPTDEPDRHGGHLQGRQVLRDAGHGAPAGSAGTEFAEGRHRRRAPRRHAASTGHGLERGRLVGRAASSERRGSGAGRPAPDSFQEARNGATGRNHAGFTMIELLMVVTIIGILLAIAVPTFLGCRDRANDRAAQTVVRHLLVSARAVAGDGEDAAAIQAGEPALQVVGPERRGTSARSSEVSVRVDQVGRQLLRHPRLAIDVGRLLRAARARRRLDRVPAARSGACTANAFDPVHRLVRPVGMTGWSSVSRAPRP